MTRVSPPAIGNSLPRRFASGFASIRAHLAARLEPWRLVVALFCLLGPSVAAAQERDLVGDRLGSIETGKWADLVVLRGNPLADIRATRDPRIVIKAGRMYDPVVLAKLVEGKLGPASAADTTAWLGASTRTP